MSKLDQYIGLFLYLGKKRPMHWSMSKHGPCCIQGAITKYLIRYIDDGFSKDKKRQIYLLKKLFGGVL